MDRAQQPFATGGLAVSSYVALGNHDGLVQGNQASTAPINAIATGCLKPLQAPAFDRGDPLGSTISGLRPGDDALLVPPDPRRRQLTKAYYASSPAAGLRFIALDTVANGGIAGISDKGNVDDPQFRWLREKLEAAERADELVVVYSHHGPMDLIAPVADEVAGPCDDPREPSNPGCDVDPRLSEPVRLGDDLVSLLLDHPHVVAWVAGHSHLNDVRPHRREDRASGFWLVRTSAEADFPHQDRLIDVMDNRDGTLSLMSALIDNAAPSATPPSGARAEDFTTEQLASLARTFGYNEPDSDRAAIGEDEDRNVELLVADPRREPRGARPAGRRVLTVRPSRVVAGRATVLRVRVTRDGRPVRGVRVRAGGRRTRTTARERARLRVRFRRTGLRRVHSGRATAPVLVVRR